MTDQPRTLGERLHASRRRRRVRRTALADTLGVAVATLRDWETGAALPSDADLSAAARALGVPADWLASGELPANDAQEWATPEGDTPPPRRAAVPMTGRLASWLARRGTPDVRAACAELAAAASLGERLRRLRRLAGLRQRDVAHALDVGAERVSMWECGRVEPDDFRLEQFAELFGVPPSALRFGRRE